MKSDFSKLIRTQQFLNFQSFFLSGTQEGYLRYCAERLIKRYRDQCSTLSVEKYDPETLLANPHFLKTHRDLFTSEATFKFIIVSEASDTITPLVSEMLAEKPKNIALVFTSPSSSKGKKLKSLHESSQNGIQINCYLNTPLEKKEYVDTLLADHELRLDSEAMEYALHCVESEPESLLDCCRKLSLYYSSAQPTVSLEDFKRCYSNQGMGQLEGFIFAIAERSLKASVQLYQQLEQAGTEEILCLRMLSSHFAKLLTLKAKIIEGLTAQQAVNSLRPPLFFKHQSLFINQLKRWEVSEIANVLQILKQTELNFKLGKPFGLMPQLYSFLINADPQVNL